jgi:hypothetical protein
MIPLDSEYPPEAGLMENLQPMVLLLYGITCFTSVKQYCENILYSNLCVGLNIAVFPDIIQLVKSTRSFPDTC